MGSAYTCRSAVAKTTEAAMVLTITLKSLLQIYFERLSTVLQTCMEAQETPKDTTVPASETYTDFYVSVGEVPMPLRSRRNRRLRAGFRVYGLGFRVWGLGFSVYRVPAW